VPRPATEILTEREAQIMDVLWRRGEALADEVREELPGRPHDSTVRTLLRILETKGFVDHEARGKSYVYRPAIERAQAQRSALRNFLGRLFSGSAEDLVLRLIEDEILTPQQLEQIQSAVPSRRSRRRKGGSS
jgi:predicted transcriptional regulator